jgi:hypothetical protein
MFNGIKRVTGCGEYREAQNDEERDLQEEENIIEEHEANNAAEAAATVGIAKRSAAHVVARLTPQLELAQTNLNIVAEEKSKAVKDHSILVRKNNSLAREVEKAKGNPIHTSKLRNEFAFLKKELRSKEIEIGRLKQETSQLKNKVKDLVSTKLCSSCDEIFANMDGRRGNQ